MGLLLASGLLLAQQKCIKGNCQNGYGTSTFPNGNKYVGDFVDGKFHGLGIFYFTDGNKYIGDWVEEVREGKGRMKFKSGAEYFGGFHRNKFHGMGMMHYADGSSYDGSWENNKPHGEGVFVFADSSRYEGSFWEGHRHGFGLMVYSDGSFFEGQWEYNKRNGQGVMTFSSGEEVRGEWEEGLFQGEWSRLSFEEDTTSLRNCNLQFCAAGRGKYYYTDGSKYIGDFFNGNPEGDGTIFYKSGDRYEGGWKNNAPHGKGIMYYLDGKVIGAIWDFGRPAKKLFLDNAGPENFPVEMDQDEEVKIWAVIVGAARYSHMPTLRYTDDDAYQLYAFLKSPEGGALPDKQVQLLIDEDATYANIVQAMRTIFLRADDNDVLLFYFSGHGIQGAFLPVDYNGTVNALPHEEIKDLLKRSRAKHKLVLADACHSGTLLAARTPFMANLKKFYKAFEYTRGGTALLMSSKGEEYSLEDGGLRSGVFSHFLVKGLKGEADGDRDNIITIRELCDYVLNKVRKYTGNVQTPMLTGNFDPSMPVGMLR